MEHGPAGLLLSATDVARHLACRHLTQLELSVAEGERPKPRFFPDPQLDALRWRGSEHERAFLDHLRAQGLDVEAMPAAEDPMAATARTRDAIERGVEVIAQGTLLGGGWRGRPDVLIRVAAPESSRGWLYEPYETKLALETRAGTLLQLCLYAELLANLQGGWPERMHVVTPGQALRPESYRVQEYLAYYRVVQRSLLESTRGRIGERERPPTYPVPCAHCDVCGFAMECVARWRQDDHLCLVAGMRRSAERELVHVGVSTLGALAAWSPSTEWRPERGARASYLALHEQAALQLASRDLTVPLHQLLPVEDKEGLARLPEPSPGDLFLDLEGDPFCGEGGLEYLFGLAAVAAEGDEQRYECWWALDRAEERRAFEQTIDRVMATWHDHPGLHVYHFGHYEPTALKRLSTRHGTREAEVDRLLRAERFVDLHQVVRQGLRAGVESYSLKQLEGLYDFRRQAPLREAGRVRAELAAALERGWGGLIEASARELVERYNRDDCLSTRALRDWLEARRAELLARGAEVPRPAPGGEGQPSEQLSERLAHVRAVAGQLLAGVPETAAQRSAEQQAVWLLAHSLEFYRREQKVAWWEFYRLSDLDTTSRQEEPCAIGGLRFESRAAEQGRSTLPTDRYGFPPQEVDARAKKARVDEKRVLGKIVQLDASQGWVEIKKTGECVDVHPDSVFLFDDIGPEPKDQALLHLAQWVCGEGGIDADGPARAGRDLLLRRPPRGCALQDGSLRSPGEEIVAAACRLALELDRGVLPFQGPPGSGKTYTGARMIVQLVRAGKKVGITALSHKVIRKLLDEVQQAAEKEGCDIRCLQRVRELSAGARTMPPRQKGAGGASTPPLPPGITETTKNDDVDRCLAVGAVDVVGGTAWLWARAELAGGIDVLFVDEAGQMALADVLAVSAATRNLVLLGDPQQLEQPIQGTHPEGCDATALEHLLAGAPTVAADRGLFIEHTRRLHPAVCRFTSEQFYEGKLQSLPGLERQALAAAAPFDHSGLYYLPVDHEGCSNASPEEARAVAALVAHWRATGAERVDEHGKRHPLTLEDVLVVAPYNAQVALLRDALPEGAQVGTVDKFQGQQAAVVIYSMTTSAPEEAPRGMEFLYSRNRLNVATSRARCACVLVANRRLLAPECHTPRQMRLANALCAYVESAAEVSWPATAASEASRPVERLDTGRLPSVR